MNRKYLIAMIATALVGCTETEPQTRPSALEGSAPPTSVEQIPPEVEREAKKAEAARQPVGPTAQPVDWGEVRGTKTLDPSLLPDDQRVKLDDIAVPVLLPDDGRLLATALITHHHDWYAAAMELKGVDIYIRGTRNAYHVASMDIPEAAAAAADNYILTRTHQIVTVSWRSFNVSYSLDVECAQPMKDTRCTEDQFALDLAERLAVANPPEQKTDTEEGTR